MTTVTTTISKKLRGVVLGSTACLIGSIGAQAADLPVKAKAVEYVKVCSLYGAGFFYIPGTDTCIKLGGYLRVDTTFNGSNVYDAPAWSGAAGQITRARNYYFSRSREDINIDTRTATEYGAVRTYFDAVFQWSTGDGIAGGTLGVYYAYIQFAGFTFGKALSQFDTPWAGYPGNQGSFLLGGRDALSGVNQFAYTAQFGNGVSVAISAEEQYAYDQAQLLNVNGTGVAGVFTGSAAGYMAGSGPGAGGFGAGYGGVASPDIVAHLRVEQAWGLFQLSGALHDIHSPYYGTTETSGHPTDAWGGAVLAALSLKNLPTGPGDTINLDATYAIGAARYVLSGLSPVGFQMFGGTSVPGAYQSLAIGTSSDGIYGAGGQIQKTTTYGIRGAFTHNWDPHWATALFGSYSKQTYNAAGTALYCAGFASVVPGQGATYTCNPNFSIAQVGTYTSWTPVKNLTFSAEMMYTWLNQSMSGVTGAVSPGGVKPFASYSFANQGTLSGMVRAQRVF